jgi:hypothetical protein
MIETLIEAEDGDFTVTTYLATVDEVVATAEIEEVEVIEPVATDEWPFSSHQFLSTTFQISYACVWDWDIPAEDSLAFPHDIEGNSRNRYWYIIQNLLFVFLQLHDFIMSQCHYPVLVKNRSKIRFPSRKFSMLDFTNLGSVSSKHEMDLLSFQNMHRRYEEQGKKQ